MTDFQNMESQRLRELEILSEIGQGKPITQRVLANKLGVALGLTNTYLKRLATKGYIKITSIPSNRVKYLLTPRGITEKSRLAYEYMSYSLKQYRRARELVQESLGALGGDGLQRIAFYGVGEAAEVAFICLKEIGLEPSAVFDDNLSGPFLGLPVFPLTVLDQARFDRIIVTSIAAGQMTESKLDRLKAMGVPEEKIVSLGL